MIKHIRIHKAEANTGALDMRHLLDAPAGKHGFVTVRGEHLYFEDGTRIRFIGMSVAARSNTPTREAADRLAERFASMGINLIRLHAADAPIGDEPGSWSSSREAPLIDYSKGDSSSLNPVGLDRFEYFISKLREKGIYLHIDLLVAREFTQGDGLDYPGGAEGCTKRYCMYNARLIELQMEYARALLTHVNPYTGVALINDPAVAVIQINNEDSAIKGAADTDKARPYKREVQARFNHFLLMKYATRENLKRAWTHEGACALGDDEDPARLTVRGVDGGFYQPVNEPDGDWAAGVSPARYADFMEFGVLVNRGYYTLMYDFLRALGAKAPIVTSNLICGAADVYGHADGDIIENNTYFNHPLLPLAQKQVYQTAGPFEYVSTNPLTWQAGAGAMATTLPALASVAVIKGKPFIISEWNEYGLHPFHSTAFVHTVAYACLNDWDGLILYNHHTSEYADDQPADEILNVFDAYNDPALICQWGFMASMFLKGMVMPATRAADIVYAKNELYTLPDKHGMPAHFLPYIMKTRNVFLENSRAYTGGADVAVNAGFFDLVNLDGAEHGVYYAWSGYSDAFRKTGRAQRLARAADGAKEVARGVYLADDRLVFSDIRALAGGGDYREFAEHMSAAMTRWGVIPEGAGYADGKLISETKQIVFDPDNARFYINTPYCAYFSGAPGASVQLGDTVRVISKNARVSISLMARDAGALADANDFLLTAMGATGMDDTKYLPGSEIMGMRITEVVMRGKLYIETLEGEVRVRARRAVMQILDPIGNVLATLESEPDVSERVFKLNGNIPGAQYRILTQ